MTQVTHTSFDLVERQQAFVGLLHSPLLTRELDPGLHRLVSRHQRELARWLGFLGHQLLTVGHTHRVRRRTEPGLAVAVPAGPAPDRRELVLLLVTAAVLEEVSVDAVDIQTISDAVRDTVAVQNLTGYDPGRRADRKLLVAAVRQAERFGVLRRLTREALTATWEEVGDGPGGGYVIDRHALFLLVDPTEVAAARDLQELPAGASAGARSLTPADAAEADPAVVRRGTLLRLLIETHGIVFADLTPELREYWRRQRSALINRAIEFTGGTVEVNAHCATLILPSDHAPARAATEAFPSAKASHWVTLKLLDRATRGGAIDADGTLHWRYENVQNACQAVDSELGGKLPKELAGLPDKIAETAERTLRELGLLRVDEGDWLISPLAARYRSATLKVSARTVSIEEDT